MSIFRERKMYSFQRLAISFLANRKSPIKSGRLSSCTHGDMRNLPEKFKLEKPVTTIGHSQSNTKNTTNKNRFFYLRRILKVKLFLTKKKRQQQIFFTNKALGTAARKRSANNIQSVSQPSSRLGSHSASSIRDNLSW